MAGYLLVPEARTDLHDILNYIAEDSVDSALRVHDRFIEIFELLAENPDAGHYRKDLTSRPAQKGLTPGSGRCVAWCCRSECQPTDFHSRPWIDRILEFRLTKQT